MCFYPPVILPPPQPTLDQGLDPVAVGAQHQVRRLLGRGEQRLVPGGVGHAEIQVPGLAGPQDLPGAAHLQVLLGDDEAAGLPPQDIQSLARLAGEGCAVEQDAEARLGPAPDPTAQLVELGQAQALRVFDDHQAGVGDVHPDLDDRGGHQQVQLPRSEGAHDRLALRPLDAPMDQPNPQLGEAFAQLAGGLLGGLTLQGLGLFDQSADPVGLPSLGAGPPDALDDLVAAAVGEGHGRDGGAARGQLVDDRKVQVGVDRHGERPGYGGGGHDELVRGQALARALLPQAHALVDAEAVLLVDDDQPQVRKGHVLLKQGMGPTMTAPDRRPSARRRRLVRGLLAPGQPEGIDSKGPEPGERWRRCCSPRSSVGAMSATWWSASTACRAARAATTVLPEPTSPWSRRSMGRGAARSAAISPKTRSWAAVKAKGRAAGSRARRDHRRPGPGPRCYAGARAGGAG